MGIQDFHDYFNLISDQYNEPYFTEEEIDAFINKATIDLVFDIVYKEFSQEQSENFKGFQVLDGVGSSIQSAMILSGITVEDETVSLSSGKKALSEMVEGHPLFLLSVKKTDGKRIKFVRDNDISARNDNDFLKPTTSYPIYTILGDNISVKPISLEEALVTYIKYPVKVSLLEEIDSDMPHFLHYKILAYALNSAGIASRDEALLSISKIAGGLPKDKQ